MNPKTKGVIFLALFLSITITIFIIIFNLDTKHSDQDEKRRLAMVGNIQFKGKVINSKVYDFAGKSYYMICVQLDTCNVKSCYVLNDLCALKIKNNIATMPGSVYDSYLGIPKYIEINMSNKGKMKLYFNSGTVDEPEWLFHANGLTEKDLNSCN